MSTSGEGPVWTWSFEDGEGRAVDVGAGEPGAVGASGAAAAPGAGPLDQPQPGFTARADAETWVGERWRQLVAAGAEVAHLSCSGETVGAPLALRPTA